MKSSLLFTAASFGFILIACSGATFDDLGQADDELSATKACYGKICGDTCTLCPPGDRNCVETANLKVCNAQGKCGPSAPQCGVGATDAGPAPYQPCAGKKCGQSCALCSPNDPSCVESAVLKFCHADGSCKDVAPACVPPPSTYEPCGGKKCGQACTLCSPNDPTCVETASLKFCQPGGACKDAVPVCQPPPPPYKPCAGKKCGQACMLCDPNDPNCVETAVLKECNAAGQCTMNGAVCN